jgi:ATP-dependent helicase/nuclease subunit B
MPTRDPHLFTIPASADFLGALIGALLDGTLVAGFPGAGDDPLRLAAATLYLPTRRACRLARDRFLDVLGTGAAVLPRIVPIADVDEDELDFAGAASGATALDLPPALDGLERRLLLAQLVARWAAAREVRTAAGTPLIAHSPAAAVALADDLARLMDDMTTRQVGWERLDGLVPDNVDEYWQLTLRFLKEIRGAWTNLLGAHGAIEPAARRDLLIKAETERLTRASGPVIAAGSTGSMPTTAELLATIARLPQGTVVLPGLDTDLDEGAWRLIGGLADPDDELDPASGHPQFAMHALLRKLGVTRDAVRVLAQPAPHGRERFVAEALRPAIATDAWQARLGTADVAAHIEQAVASLTVIEAGNAEEEALAVAIALREAAEFAGKTAALVTPDRALARRVRAALARWDVPVDDSGGDALADTPAGVFARLALDVALGEVAPVPLLALLKHPLSDADAGAVTALERAVLRGPRPGPGIAGLAHALTHLRATRADLHARDPRRSLREADFDSADALVATLAAALAPLLALARASQPFTRLLHAHAEVIGALSARAFAGHDGTALAEAFEQGFASSAGEVFEIKPPDYADLFGAVVADAVVRRPEVPGVRVRILGPLEQRLQSFDRVVLGGLTEGTWPPQARTDPWLSRPMRRDLGLDLPERRVGLSAHDFAQALGASEVMLARAARVGGSPTVASRFVQRLAAVAGDRWTQAIARGDRYLAYARDLDRPAQPRRIKRPAPAPPLAARPTRLSVTDIENWLRDPYTIYAKHILRLPVLEAVDTPPGAADRGTVIHEAIAEFTARFADGLPADPVAELLAIGEKHFAALQDFPEARAFWWPRFRRIAQWFVEWEDQRRPQIDMLFAERDGFIEFPVGAGTFLLRTRADRIERLADGRLAVLDYKTGRVPSTPQVQAGMSPQLTLEAAILRGGHFENVPAGGSVAELVYVSLKGGDPGGEDKAVEFKDSAPDAEAERALEKLKTVAARFADAAQPYRSLVHPMWRTHYGDYDHLARVKEWAETGGAGEEGLE